MKPGATTFAVIAAGAELAGQRPGHPDQAGLGRGVVDLAGRAEQADHRGDEDDPAEPAPHHRPRRPPGDPERTGQVGGDHRVPVVVGHPHQQRVPGDAGVGDHHLDVAEGGLDLGERGLDLSRIGHVTLDAEHAGRHLAAAIGGGHPMAGPGQPGGDAVPDSLAAAGDQDDPGEALLSTEDSATSSALDAFTWSRYRALRIGRKAGVG